MTRYRPEITIPTNVAENTHMNPPKTPRKKMILNYLDQMLGHG